MTTAADVKRALASYADPAKAHVLAGFFKTGPGEYGEGDSFLGVVVPDSRTVAKRFVNLPFSQLELLLVSKVHEHRLVALLILTYRYPHADSSTKEAIYAFYLKNAARVNNWDLVDCSAPNIVGAHLRSRSRAILYRLAKSRSLWERRIAIVATFAFIRDGDFDDTLRIAALLLADTQDLLHKATGWMLREVGKRDERALKNFLRQHAPAMPRTMLRYAIERLPERERQDYLRKTL